jgi:hypothetical protein
MKTIHRNYFLIISIILICTALCGGQNQIAGITIIEVKVLPVIKLVVINDSNKWVLNPSEPGLETQEGSLLIRANIPWMVGVRDYDPITMGHMTEWNGKVYGTRKLSNPLSVSAESEVVLPDGGLIQSGERTSGQQISFYFTQEVAWEDEPILEDATYRIVATFYAVPRF